MKVINKSTAFLDTFILESMPEECTLPKLDNPYSNHNATLNIAECLLDNTAKNYPNKVCIYYQNTAWTYQDLNNITNKIANYLVIQYQFKPGERVLLQAPNSPMLVACWLAVLKVGGVCITTMHLSRQAELTRIIDKAKINYALCDTNSYNEITQANLVCKQIKFIEKFSLLNDGSESLDQQIKIYPNIFSPIKTQATDPAILAFTSGTTGTAKGTIHTHADLRIVSELYPKQKLQLNKNDICCGTPSLAFTFGLGALLLFPMRAGASIVFPENNKPETLLKTIKQHHVTIFYSVPTMYQRLLPLADHSSIACLRKCVSAGEHLPAALHEAWQEKFRLSLINSIGSTEMLHIFIASDDKDKNKPGSLGKPLVGYQAKIVDDFGQEIPRGQIGRLAVQGATGCRYLNNAEEQKKYVKESWNITGDFCLQDEDGCFWYQSRSDDLIVSSGYNISAIEIENALLDYQFVKECAVVGEPDEQRGQVVKAFVVLHQAAEESETIKTDIQNYVKNKLSPYKYPRKICFIHELPRNINGKIQRHMLRNYSV